jgi:hypothetical protein
LFFASTNDVSTRGRVLNQRWKTQIDDFLFFIFFKLIFLACELCSSNFTTTQQYIYTTTTTSTFYFLFFNLILSVGGSSAPFNHGKSAAVNGKTPPPSSCAPDAVRMFTRGVLLVFFSISRTHDNPKLCATVSLG